MKDRNTMSKVRTIAFYLPQFYPTPENDEWWEPGFTEWTNVAKAKPLYRGHYQPRIPKDLGFYDLRVPETREKQALLAREAGIEGFCYWHYWFAGRRLLDRVFTEVVESGKPDFPFCLCWANHSWYKKTWMPDMPDQLLIEQTYPGKQDYINHFYAMLPAFKDKRYIRTNSGELVFGIFDPVGFKDFPTFKKVWNDLAKENGLEGFHFFAFSWSFVLPTFGTTQYNSIVIDPMFDYKYKKKSWFQKQINDFKTFHINRAIIHKYDDYTKESITFFQRYPNYAPCIYPDFDHSPRSGRYGFIMKGSTPQKWGEFLRTVHEIAYSNQNHFLFIKAWNEWGEGNYLEPDQLWGNSYLIETKSVLTNNGSVIL